MSEELKLYLIRYYYSTPKEFEENTPKELYNEFCSNMEIDFKKFEQDNKEELESILIMNKLTE